MQLIWTSDERPVAATRGATCESRKRHVLVPRGAEERVRRRNPEKERLKLKCMYVGVPSPSDADTAPPRRAPRIHAIREPRRGLKRPLRVQAAIAAAEVRAPVELDVQRNVALPELWAKRWRACSP